MIPVVYEYSDAVMHFGSPYPPGCSGVWGVKAAFRPLFQHATPVAVVLTAPSSQEGRHSLGRPLSPLRGSLLRPGRRPRDADLGTGPCGQVTEHGERGDVQPAPAHQPDHGVRLGAYSTMSAPLFSTILGAETSVPLVARRPASPSS